MLAIILAQILRINAEKGIHLNKKALMKLTLGTNVIKHFNILKNIVDINTSINSVKNSIIIILNYTNISVN